MTSYINKLLILVSSAAALVLFGCAAMDEGETNPSQIKTQWVSPYASLEHKAVSSLLVTCTATDVANQRVCEDSVANMFTFRGVTSQPSYLYVENSANLLESNGALNIHKVAEIAKKAKVTDILVIADQGDQTKEIVEPGDTVDFGPVLMRGPGPMGPPPMGPGPMGPPMGPGPMGPPPGPMGPPGPPPPPGPGPGFIFVPGGVYTTGPTVTHVTIKQTSVQLLHGSDGTVLWTATASTVLGQTATQRMYELYADMVYNQLTQDGFMFPAAGTVVAPGVQQNSSPVLKPGIYPVN